MGRACTAEGSYGRCLIPDSGFFFSIKRRAFRIQLNHASRRVDSALVSAIVHASLPRRSVSRMDKIRNIAIIAHVDHGKTTLVDQLLRQSGTFRSNQKIEERRMDSM